MGLKCGLELQTAHLFVSKQNETVGEVIRRKPHGHAIARQNLDTEAPHFSTELRIQLLLIHIELHFVDTTGGDIDNGSFDFHEIISRHA